MAKRPEQQNTQPRALLPRRPARMRGGYRDLVEALAAIVMRRLTEEQQDVVQYERPERNKRAA